MSSCTCYFLYFSSTCFRFFSSYTLMAFYNYYWIFLFAYQQDVQRPSIFYFYVEERSRNVHYIRKHCLEVNLPQIQHQCLMSVYLNGCREIEHYLVCQCFVISFNIYAYVVRSLAVCPREFLLSSVTPYCKNALNIQGAAPAAANMTLLFPEQSTSYQCKPALSNISVTSK